MIKENDELLEKEIDKLIEIYEMLISQPTPEEEEQAQRDLLVILKEVKDMLGDFDQFHELDELYQIISKWDTLESWFYEIIGLEDKLVNFLSKFRHVNKRKDKKEPRELFPISQGKIQSSDSEIDKEKESRMNVTLQTVEKKMKNLMTRDSLIQDYSPPVINQPAHIEIVSKSPTPHLKSKLVAPKIIIPPVMAPKKKIVPDSMSYSNLNHQTQEKDPIKIDYTPPESQSKAEFHPKINPISSTQKTIKIHPITSDQFKNTQSSQRSQKSQKSQSIVDSQTEDLNKLSSKELYRELIRLEAKQYHIIKQQKILGEKYNARQISESLFNSTREETNLEVKSCINKINHIKSIINR